MKNKAGPVVCIGASLVDITFRCEKEPMLHTSNPSEIQKSPGGVVRNIAHHLSMLGIKSELLTIVGNDAEGEWLLQKCSDAGIGLNFVGRAPAPTGTFASITSPAGDLTIGAVVSDTDFYLTKEFILERMAVIETASLVVADCNLSTETLRELIRLCNEKNVPLIIETVSIPKAERLKEALPGKLLLVKPNREELAVFESGSHVTPEEKITHLHTFGFQYVWLSRGAEGSLFSDGITMSAVPAPRVQVIDVNGAGDASLAGWIYAWLKDKPLLECIHYGHAAAACLLEVNGAVRNDFSVTLLEQHLQRT
jgi:pseudouridine kinase